MLDNDQYDRVFKSFKEQYSSLPGIMDIREDNWFGDTFIIAFDRRKFQEGSIPSSYQEVDTILIDVYKDKQHIDSLLDEYKNVKADDPVMMHFKHRLEWINQLIDKYERP
jgi:hypothetical protein